MSAGIVVCTPVMRVSRSARSVLAMAVSRSLPQHTSFPIRLS